MHVPALRSTPSASYRAAARQSQRDIRDSSIAVTCVPIPPLQKIGERLCSFCLESCMIIDN